MIFFTDITTNCSNYCLLNINKYYDERKNTKKLIFIDPGVMELRKSLEYKQIQLLHYLADNHLQSNEYISIDYPCDMNLNHSDEFIQKSIENNWQYASNLQYICTIQYDWMVYTDFEYRMKELEPIYNGKKKIVGLGNLCRLFTKRENCTHFSAEYKYCQKVFNYLLKNKEKFYWIHIYGFAKYGITEFIPLLQNYAPNIIISVDSTKWTRVSSKALHRKYVKAKNQAQLIPTQHKISGIGCTKETRTEFFLGYMKQLIKKNIKVIF